MDEVLDQITSFLSDLPIGLIIFLIAILFSFFGRGENEARQQRQPQREGTPERAPADPFGFGDEERPTHTFASDERRAREERDQREREEVLVFGGMEFGRRGSLFDEDEDNRESQWGKTKYGFDESEWGSAFGDKKDSEPVIR